MKNISYSKKEYYSQISKNIRYIMKSSIFRLFVGLFILATLPLGLVLYNKQQDSRSFAQGVSTASAGSIEAEEGTLSGNATIGNDTNASGGRFLQLGQVGSGITPTPAQPTPPPIGVSRCPAFPAFPDADCTGLIPGTALTNCSTTLSTANATYDKCVFNGGVDVNANNITITNSRVLGVVSGSGSGLKLIDVEINGQNSTLDAFNGMSNYSCTRCNVYNAAKAFTGSEFTVVDSYVHDLYGSGDSHNETALGSGDNIIIQHSNLIAKFNSSSTGGGMSSSVSLYTHGSFWGPMNNVQLEKNRLETTEAYYCLYGGYSTTRAATNVRVLSNYFYVNPTSGTCGTAGPIVGWKQGGGNVWSGNAMLQSNGTTAPLAEPASSPY